MTISLAQQIEEVERELALRARVYPHQVASRRMRASVAEFHMARMQAVRATLLWLEQNEAKVRKAIGELP